MEPCWLSRKAAILQPSLQTTEMRACCARKDDLEAFWESIAPLFSGLRLALPPLRLLGWRLASLPLHEHGLLALLPLQNCADCCNLVSNQCKLVPNYYKLMSKSYQNYRQICWPASTARFFGKSSLLLYN